MKHLLVIGVICSVLATAFSTSEFTAKVRRAIAIDGRLVDGLVLETKRVGEATPDEKKVGVCSVPSTVM